MMDRRSAIAGAAAAAAAIVAEGAAPAGAQTPSPAPSDGPSERVLGFGGFFFRSADPKALARWYQQHLGIDPVPATYGGRVWQQAAGPTAFSPFPADTGYFGSPQQAFLLNFRVRSLDAMVAQLNGAGIAVKVDAATYPNGRFARLHDPDGNPIELWEPAG